MSFLLWRNFSLKEFLTFLLLSININELSKILNILPLDNTYAAMVESADTRDLKSLGSNTVPVQVWLAAPI